MIKRTHLLKLLSTAFLATPLMVGAQTGGYNDNPFKQLDELLPTPNEYRTGSGAPGHAYFQQKADYNIDVTLNDENQSITGVETITYTNNSPDVLSYLWLQLDQNMRAQDSDTKKIRQSEISESMSFYSMEYAMSDFDGGFKIDAVTQTNGSELQYVVNKTMMRIDLPKDLQPGASYSFTVKYHYNINNRMEIGGRSGYEFFEEDGNYLYTIAQFFPRMAVYDDVNGWQHKQFLGRGEFALPFGDYKVSITVPADHVVGATGQLTNASSVMNSEQRSRFKKAQSADQPVMIITQEEAEAKELKRSEKTNTWVFEAENVRDFAFASSRKFIWDAQAVQVGGKNIMCMSYYPKEGNPLWEKYSTRVVAHTIETYSKYTVDYPYPVAISVHSKSIGMEYPMICFNGGRPEKDGTYSERTKYGMISVITHEVGHNFFPMIINSDERQWTWMDEGLNTFVQYLTEQEWDRNYPSRRGPAYKIVPYMKGDPNTMVPIMTNSESIKQFGNNAYAKPATGLVILRETIMGPELFDYAFKEYCERWKLKHPMPADFYRSMEDASGVDLDWFWRGWFYTTWNNDQAIVDMKWYKINTQNPEVEKPHEQEVAMRGEINISERNSSLNPDSTYVEKHEAETQDFYSIHSPYEIMDYDVIAYENYMGGLSDEEKEMVNSDLNFYEIKIERKGGLVMPVILLFTFADGSQELVKIPAEIWKNDDLVVSKVFWFDKEVVALALDPYLETADVDMTNNNWPPKMELNKFQLYQQKQYSKYGQRKKSRMQKAQSK